MVHTAEVPGVADLDGVLDALAEWQADDAPVHLHPGDLGWHWRFGAGTVADSLRVWRRGGRIAVVGFLDGPTLLRLALDPAADDDEVLARQVLADLADPAHGVLPAGSACVEARSGTALRTLLSAEGWRADEAWTPLRHDLEDDLVTPADNAALTIEHATPDRVADRVAVHGASFSTTSFTEAAWHTMAAGTPYADGRRLGGRCLVAHDDSGTAVAAVTVWSAGPGRPGLVEPMGVHAQHRGRGYGTAVTVAAVAALKDLGCSSALVATPTANAAAVATYVAAGFQADEPVTDYRRP